MSPSVVTPAFPLHVGEWVYINSVTGSFEALRRKKKKIRRDILNLNGGIIIHTSQVTEGKESPFRLDIVSNACFKIRVYLKT